ncbi:hypothetical protein SPI_02496 [Niveomyces insectorum RCEF 264]|uniref:Uncharacterized protein n=1 Tax=Niveomyces insectorum RCEF 264 TaxID=1081102 RepID=A0A167Y1I3_9HYPO|nr:hypothetical protein SPI_02496 [Niveomyces insectorum RCEF 264]
MPVYSSNKSGSEYRPAPYEAWRKKTTVQPIPIPRPKVPRPEEPWQSNWEPSERPPRRCPGTSPPAPTPAPIVPLMTAADFPKIVPQPRPKAEPIDYKKQLRPGPSIYRERPMCETTGTEPGKAPDPAKKVQFLLPSETQKDTTEPGNAPGPVKKVRFLLPDETQKTANEKGKIPGFVRKISFCLPGESRRASIKPSKASSPTRNVEFLLPDVRPPRKPRHFQGTDGGN